MQNVRRRLLAGGVGVWLSVWAVGCGRADQATTPAATAGGAVSVEEVEAIAEEGFVYGLPIVMSYAVMYEYAIDRSSSQFKAPFNEINHEHRVYTYQDTSVITPNSDTPYSMLFADLRAEPLVVSVPAVEKKRYYSLMLVDGNTFNYGYVGSRATGNEPGDYLIAGPGWKGETPAGIKQVFRSSTDFTAGVFRTQLFGADDMPAVIAVQSGYRLQPLSAYLKQPAPPPPAPVEWPKVDANLVKTNFFEYLDFALQFSPPGPEENAIRAKLARIGVGPGKTMALGDLSPEQKAALARGMAAGDKKVDEAVANIGTTVNGWHVGSAFGNREYYNGNWALRAAAARAGIYGNNAEEAMYPMVKTLADGTPLDGSTHKYALTFAKDQFPPVRAFWSVTMYDGKTQLLIKNPIDRYLINSPMLPAMKKNADGSVTLHLQKDSPGKDKESNWLPAPDGPMYVVMRLYWPTDTPPSILPPGQGTWQPPAIVEVK